MATILVIDEDQHWLEFLRGAITAAGHQAVTVGNAALAEKLFDAMEFDAVVVEVLQREKDGVELIRALKRRPNACPILAISGGGAVIKAHNLLKIAEAVGADAILAKPFSASELCWTLEGLLSTAHTP